MHIHEFNWLKFFYFITYLLLKEFIFAFWYILYVWNACCSLRYYINEMKTFKSRLVCEKTFQFTWFKCRILVITVIKRIQFNQCRIHVAVTLIYYFDREALSCCFQFTNRILHINNTRAIIYLFRLSYFYININHFFILI